MALTTYAGSSKPYFVPFVTSGQDLSSIQSSQVASSASNTSANSIGLIQPGDVLLVGICFPSNTAAVSSVVINGAAGLTFTRLVSVVIGTSAKLEIWSAIYGGTSQYPSPGTITVTLNTALVEWAYDLTQIRNASGIDATVNTGTIGAATTITSSSTASVRQNALAVDYLGVRSLNSAVQTANSERAHPVKMSTMLGTAAGATNMTSLQSCVFDMLAKNSSVSHKTVYGANVIGGAYASVVVYGPTIQLDDVSPTYLFGEDGQLLNNPSGALPLWDVEAVQGLSDVTVNVQSQTIDGTDGNYVTGKFLTSKTIVIEGTTYLPSPVDEAQFDGLRQFATPSENGIPFFYKYYNNPVRYMVAKLLGFKSDVDRSRTLASVPFQLQLETPDPYSYEERLYQIDNIATSGVFSLSWVQGGNAEMLPYIYFTKYTGDAVVGTNFFAIDCPTWISNLYGTIDDSSIALAIAASAPLITIGPVNLMSNGIYRLNIKDRTFERFGYQGFWEDQSFFLIKRTWFSLIPGSLNLINFTRPGSSTITDDGFKVAYANAWR